MTSIFNIIAYNFPTSWPKQHLFTCRLLGFRHWPKLHGTSSSKLPWWPEVVYLWPIWCRTFMVNVTSMFFVPRKWCLIWKQWLQANIRKSFTSSRGSPADIWLICNSTGVSLYNFQYVSFIFISPEMLEWLSCILRPIPKQERFGDFFQQNRRLHLAWHATRSRGSSDAAVPDRWQVQIRVWDLGLKEIWSSLSLPNIFPKLGFNFYRKITGKNDGCLPIWPPKTSACASDRHCRVLCTSSNHDTNCGVEMVGHAILNSPKHTNTHTLCDNSTRGYKMTKKSTQRFPKSQRFKMLRRLRSLVLKGHRLASQLRPLSPSGQPW